MAGPDLEKGLTGQRRTSCKKPGKSIKNTKVFGRAQRILVLCLADTVLMVSYGLATGTSC